MSVIAAVLGGDVSRSLSPVLHRAAAQDRGISLEYRALSCANEAAFRAAVRALAGEGARGASVTIPFKTSAFELATELSPLARAIGAVNCLTFGDAPQIAGDNTDGPALVFELSKLPRAALARVQILGAGGAARAAAWALAQCGAGEVVVSARRREEAEAVAALAGGAGRALAPVEGASLVISTLPRDAALAAEAIDRWIAGAHAPHIFDLAYGTAGGATPLVEAARARGWVAQDGLGMLVEQAALAFVRWLGGELPRTRQAMWAAIGPL